MKKIIKIFSLLILLLLTLYLAGCTLSELNSIYPKPPTTEQLMQEQQDGQLEDPFPLQSPGIDGIQIE